MRGTPEKIIFRSDRVPTPMHFLEERFEWSTRHIYRLKNMNLIYKTQGDSLLLKIKFTNYPRKHLKHLSTQNL